MGSGQETVSSWQEDPAHSGVSQAQLALPLSTSWSVESDAGFIGALASHGLVFLDSTDATHPITAVRATDGSVAWRAGQRGLNSAAPSLALDGTRVLASTTLSNGTGLLQAYDTVSGRQLYSVPTAVGEGGLVAVDGVVVSNRVAAYDDTTGAKLWTAPGSASQVAIRHDLVITGGATYALRTGHKVWSLPTGCEADTPQASATSVVVYRCYDATARDVDTGQITDLAFGYPVALDDDTEVGVLGAALYGRVARSPRSWMIRPVGGIATSPVTTQAGTLTLLGSGQLLVIDPRTGKSLQSVSLSAPGYSTSQPGPKPSILAVNGLVVVPLGHRLVALRSATTSAPHPTAAKTATADSPSRSSVTTLSTPTASDWQAGPARNGDATGSGVTESLSHKWSHMFPGQVEQTAVASGHVIASVFPDINTGPGDRQIRVLSEADGHETWPGPWDIAAFSSTMTTDASRQDAVLVEVYAGGPVFALSVTTGKLLWIVDGVPTGEAPPIATGGVLVVGEGDYAGIDDSTGALLWKQQSSVNGDLGPIATDGKYFFAADTCGALGAQSVATGQVKYDQGDNGSCYGGQGALPMAVGNGLIVERPDGGTRDQALVRSTVDGHVVSSSAGVLNDRYVPVLGPDAAIGGNGGDLSSLAVAPGGHTWRSSDPCLDQPPLLIGNVVWCASGGDGSEINQTPALTAYNTTDGSLAATAPLASRPSVVYDSNSDLPAGLAAADGLMLVPELRTLEALGSP